MTRPKIPDAVLQSGIDPTEELVKAIKFRALQLCTLISDSAPKGRRLESALGSIRAGAGLAIDEIRGSRETRLSLKDK